MDDINKVWLRGQAISSPTLTKLGVRTPMCSFLLQVNERFVDSDGKTKTTPHVFTVESLGRSANITLESVREGQLYNIEGYLRTSKNRSEVTIRTFAVTKVDERIAESYYQGLEQALEVLTTSRDKDAAYNRLVTILAEARNED